MGLARKNWGRPHQCDACCFNVFVILGYVLVITNHFICQVCVLLSHIHATYSWFYPNLGRKSTSYCWSFLHLNFGVRSRNYDRLLSVWLKIIQIYQGLKIDKSAKSMLNWNLFNFTYIYWKIPILLGPCSFFYWAMVLVYGSSSASMHLRLFTFDSQTFDAKDHKFEMGRQVRSDPGRWWNVLLWFCVISEMEGTCFVFFQIFSVVLK